MEYFILKTTDGGYWCVNSVVRGKDATDKDSVSFICSGRLVTMPIERVVGFFPSTPVPGTVL